MQSSVQESVRNQNTAHLVADADRERLWKAEIEDSVSRLEQQVALMSPCGTRAAGSVEASSDADVHAPSLAQLHRQLEEVRQLGTAWEGARGLIISTLRLLGCCSFARLSSELRHLKG
jgi:hypothetical protein